jgi:hypothetical protein
LTQINAPQPQFDDDEAVLLLSKLKAALCAAFSFDLAKPASESPMCARPSGYLDALGTAETPQFQAR